MSRRTVLTGALAALAAAGCAATEPAPVARPTASPTRGPVPTRPRRTASPAPTRTPPASAATMAARATVPVLCWHQLREWEAGDSEYDRRLLICPPAAFRAQLDALAAGGYTTISADRYHDHITTGAPLPARPVLLTFDDAQGSHASVGLPELVRRRMTATFFVMTVVLDKPGWLRRADLPRLARAGMTVGAHTWDHHRADRYTAADWPVQLVQPRAELERILGREVRDFAYPYGAWSKADFPQLAAAGYRTAYQLADRTPDPAHPLLTLRRTLVDSTWTGPQLLRRMS